MLRALARRPDGRPAWPAYEQVLRQATVVLVLAEVDYFLRGERTAMRKLVAELFDPTTTYEFESVLPTHTVRALQIDAKFRKPELGLVDGSVAAVAARRRIYCVFTIDRRDFGTLRIGERYNRALTLLPEQP